MLSRECLERLLVYFVETIHRQTLCSPFALQVSLERYDINAVGNRHDTFLCIPCLTISLNQCRMHSPVFNVKFLLRYKIHQNVGDERRDLNPERIFVIKYFMSISMNSMKLRLLSVL